MADVQRLINKLPKPDYDKYSREEIDNKLDSIPLEQYVTLALLDKSLESMKTSLDKKIEGRDLEATKKAITSNISKITNRNMRSASHHTPKG